MEIEENDPITKVISGATAPEEEVSTAEGSPDISTSSNCFLMVVSKGPDVETSEGIVVPVGATAGVATFTLEDPAALVAPSTAFMELNLISGVDLEDGRGLMGRPRSSNRRALERFLVRPSRDTSYVSAVAPSTEGSGVNVAMNGSSTGVVTESNPLNLNGSREESWRSPEFTGTCLTVRTSPLRDCIVSGLGDLSEASTSSTISQEGKEKLVEQDNQDMNETREVGAHSNLAETPENILALIETPQIKCE